jgi:hypothetical protein
MLRSMAVAALLLGLAGAAVAADEKNAPPTPEVMFGRLDANGDKKLSLTEFKNVTTELAATGKKGKDKKPAPAVVPEEVFKKLDTNSDKSLTAAEFKFLSDVVNPPAPVKKKKK